MGNKTITAVVLAGALALAAAGCGTGDGQGNAEPVPTTSVSDGLPLDDNPGAQADETVLVEGFIITDGDAVELASALAESYPPQAAGVVLTVIGLDVGSIEGLTSSGGISWTDHQVQLRGVVDGDVLTVLSAPTTDDGTDATGPFLDIDDDGTVIYVEVGDVVTLQLEGNPTTGFTWEITTIDEMVLIVLGDPQYQSDSDLIGSPGVFTFQLRAIAEGETPVQLAYHRSWEETEPLQTYGFTVVVG